MIKKLLTITSGVVLGSLLTTASLASTFAASEDCQNARTDVKAVIGVIQDCKAVSSPWGCNSIPHAGASACKRACAAVQDDICLYGSYPDPVVAGSMYEECDNCVETLCPSVVGDWTLSLQIGCGGNPIRGRVIFNGNSTRDCSKWICDCSNI